MITLQIVCDAATEISEWKLENTEKNITIVYSKETMSDVAKKLHCQKRRKIFEFSHKTSPRNDRETSDCEKSVEVLLADVTNYILCAYEASDVTAENSEAFLAGNSGSNFYQNLDGMDLNRDKTDRNHAETNRNHAETDQNPDKTDRNPDKTDQNLDETDRNLPNSSPIAGENDLAFCDREGLISPPFLGAAENSSNAGKDRPSHEIYWSSLLGKTRYICNKEIPYIVATSVTVKQAQRSRLEYLELTAPWSTGRR
jgi:hypothetical protein